MIIRDVQASDADSFYSYMQQEHYWRHLPIEPPTAASIATLIEHCVLEQAKQPRTRYFMAAVDKNSDELWGEAILRIHSHRWQQGEIGWGIRVDRQGQGLATEIGLAMLRLAFDTFDLHRVYAQCRLENQASCRIMTKLGKRKEGTLRENVLARGVWWSSVQYSILSTDFRIWPA